MCVSVCVYLPIENTHRQHIDSYAEIKNRRGLGYYLRNNINY